MSLHSRLDPVQSAVPPRPAKPGPCFRTDAEGRIALSRDWPRLFSEARRFPGLALQTRHTYVRLVHVGPLPELTWNARNAVASDHTGSLRFNAAKWQHASGRLAECACCGTPGRVEITNPHGLDFLQLCALPDCPPTDWADYLLDVFAHGEPTAPTPATKRAAFPLAPAGCVIAGHAAADQLLPDFITALSASSLSFTAILQTPEVVHVREIQPHRVMLDGTMLTIQADNSTLQIGLPAVRQLAIGVSPEHGPQLHLLGPDRTLLLTLSAAHGAIETARWAAALRTSFPTNP